MASEEEKADEAAAKKYHGLGGDIHQAAGLGDVPALRHFLRVAPERVHEKGSFCMTPLHFAARNGHVAAAELLISKGAAVDAKNINGSTPLHWAALNGHVAAAELLLSKGAAVDAKTDGDGSTPLHFAANDGHVAVAELLLSKGAAVDAKSNEGLSRGKTPLDLATERGKTEMVQFLRNPPAKKPSPDDGQTPRDLSSKGKAEKEPLPTAADKTSEAGKKAQQTAVFPFSSPRRQTSKEDAAPHAAGSGAVAVKHQRETSKEAAKALKKAMESGNVEVLKEAIAAAKAEKVSQEDMLEAMEKYMALKESATTSKAEKLVTTSKAESSVKLEPGHKARLAMFSARFNEKNKDTEMKFRAVHKLLTENHYEILMVDAGAGKSFGDDTLKYLRRLGEEKGVMLAVCTSDYGEMTDSPFCTYYELKLAKEYNVDVLPLQVEDNWKPCPPCGEGHRDHLKSALDYIHAVFLPSIVRIDCRKKRVEEIASEIAASLRKP